MTATYETASNAVVATVGFYAGALADLAETIQRLEKKAAELELQRNQLAIANAKLSDEELAARRVVDLARKVVEGKVQVYEADDADSVAMVALMHGVGVYDAGR
jgi:hypothetical protein